MRRPRVYISGPVSSGNRNHNQFQGCEAHKALMLAGFAPLNPIITGNIPFAWGKDVPHSLWLDCDMPWVEVSDAVLRLPGYSVGADAECTYATECGIPIMYSVEELVKWKAGLSSDFVGMPEAEKIAQPGDSSTQDGCVSRLRTEFATY